MRFFPSSFFLLELVVDIYTGHCVDLAACVSECFSTLVASRKVIREPRCQCVWEQKWDMTPLSSAGFAQPLAVRVPAQEPFLPGLIQPIHGSMPKLFLCLTFLSSTSVSYISIIFLQHLFPRLTTYHPLFDVSNIFIPILRDGGVEAYKCSSRTGAQIQAVQLCIFCIKDRTGVDRVF